jgi:hypothetical protein
MSDFDRCRAVETRAMVVLLPFLNESSDGRYVLTGKGRLARFLQQELGDAIFNDRAGRVWSVEIKAEERHTGNLFIETWSNRNLTDRSSHSERGSNPGWALKLRADLLFYYFLDADSLYIIDMFELKRWLFGYGQQVGNIYRFPEVVQSKWSQANETVGRLVKLDDLQRDLKIRRIFPRQIPMFPEAA